MTDATMIIESVPAWRSIPLPDTSPGRQRNVAYLRAMGGDSTCSSWLQQQHTGCLGVVVAINAPERQDQCYSKQPPAAVQRELQCWEEVAMTLICKLSSPAASFICTGEGLAAEEVSWYWRNAIKAVCNWEASKSWISSENPDFHTPSSSPRITPQISGGNNVKKLTRITISSWCFEGKIVINQDSKHF